MRYVQPSASQLRAAAIMPTAAGVGLAPAQIEAEIDAGRLRPEWSVVAVGDDETIFGRALWWGRDESTPIALDVWDANPDQPDAAGVLSELLAHGHTALRDTGVGLPLPHTMRVPTDWRAIDPIRTDVERKTRAAAVAGFLHSNERRQFQWDEDQPLPPEPSDLSFEPADDATFVRLFARAARGSLDVMTRRELATTDADELARNELEYYRSCPGERHWWRVAYDQAGETVGIAIPSATPTDRNVGYLAVLPEHRGHAYVDDLLAYITRFHARAHAPCITATTDAINTPMSSAFERAGYRCIETRIDLER